MKRRWTFRNIYERSRTVRYGERSGTLDGLKRLQNHISRSRFKIERNTVVNIPLTYGYQYGLKQVQIRIS
jgi:hypothetical protein